jgi:tRNA(fMet)-specific endonuclease VapC
MATYILDTDTLTHLRANHPEVTRRAAAVSPGELVTTVVTVDEVLTGWYSIARNANRPDTIERAYGHLAGAIQFFAGIPILNFTQPAIARYDQLKAAKLNIGRNDLRIGAIALECGAVVVTRNARDFGRIPGLTIEDWTLPPGGPIASGS